MMTSHSNEVPVWAWTEDYDLIVTEDLEGFIYGVQNRHTEVIEMTSPVFGHAVQALQVCQDSWDAAQSTINEDGSLMEDGYIKVAQKEEGGLH